MLLRFVALVNTMSLAVGFPALLTDRESDNEVSSYDFPFVPRSGWGARTPKETLPLRTPVPYVVIHHSYIPPACYSREQCNKAMQQMQNFHMDDRDWADIGYNFAVGSDGFAYEGRGWTTLGAQALHFNSVSIGICLIGDWRTEVPPADQLKTAKAVIAAGVELGYIRPDYKLVGHRQVRDTECPGDALFAEIQHWAHYSSFPSSPADLLKVSEIPESVKEIIRGNATSNV